MVTDFDLVVGIADHDVGISGHVQSDTPSRHWISFNF